MRNIFLGLIAATTLITPAIARDKARDGYHFARAEWTKNTMTVNVIWYKTSKELEAAAKALNVPVIKGNKMGAFSIINEAENRCTIHTVEPEEKYAPELVGHEFIHCFKGRFHEGQQPFYL